MTSADRVPAPSDQSDRTGHPAPPDAPPRSFGRPRRTGPPTDRTFASDNWSGIHPRVLEAVVAANIGHVPSYGEDPATVEALGHLRRHFGETADICLVLNGSGANVVGLQSLLRPFEAVICASGAHINVDECGALEHIAGSKLVPVATDDGKLTPDLVARAATGAGDQHHVQPRVVSITQPTEVGTTYRPDEIAALGRWAHDHAMFLHVDGARLSNAAAFLGVGLDSFGADIGIDLLSYGATKNGALGAEAVVSFVAPEDSPLPFIRKQSLQLASKMRFVAVQFTALMAEDLWLENARHANAMARRLADGMAGIEDVRIVHPVEANGVFADIPPRVAAAVQDEFPFYTWDTSRGTVRWLCSFDTTEEDVEAFVELMAEAMGELG